MNREPDVLVVGAGPAGLSAARVLRDLGVKEVVVVDREPEAGGMPRFCPHPTFGVADFYRPMSGPAYAKRLLARVDPRWIATSTTAVTVGSSRETVLSSPAGETTIRPKRILFATGIRETPRAARLVSGDRPRNILTTGALQRMLAERRQLPFSRPVIIGSELVSFSALLSLREAGVAAVAMIEQGERIIARRPADLLTRFILRTPIRLESRLIRVNAAADDAARMRSVILVSADGVQSELDCDAVIFTGRFTPEVSLIGNDRDLLDHGAAGPAIDQCWRLAAFGFYAAGNVLRAVETAAWCAREGAAAARALAADHFCLSQPLERRIPIVTQWPIAFSTPSYFALPALAGEKLTLGIRMTAAARGRIVLSVDGKVLWRSAAVTALPQRRITISPGFLDLKGASEIRIFFELGG